MTITKAKDIAFNNRLDKGNWADLGKKIIVKDKERNNSRLVDKQEEEKNIIKRMGIEKGKKGGTLIKGGKG